MGGSALADTDSGPDAVKPVGCPTGKVVFDRHGAQVWARRQREMGRDRIEAYGCHLCGGWHTGRSRTRHWKQKRREQT